MAPTFSLAPLCKKIDLQRHTKVPAARSIQYEAVALAGGGMVAVYRWYGAEDIRLRRAKIG